MDFAKKVLLFCVVFCAAVCSADQNHYLNGQACLVQHLKTKGKLNQSFQSTLEPTSRCRLVMPLTIQILKTSVTDRVKNDFPNEADCLNDEFDNKEAVDFLIKLDVIKSSTLLSVSARDTQLEDTRSLFKDDLEDIARQCLVDDKNFVKIFNDVLGIKNETLVAYQHEYCMAKYVVDNDLLEVNNLDINPQRIDTNNVNCDYIIDVERSKTEKELSDKLSATPEGQRSLSCVLNAFRSGNMFGYKIALIVLNNLDVTSEVKVEQSNKISVKLGEFAMSTFMCAMG